jgi:hypothetical protein
MKVLIVEPYLSNKEHLIFNSSVIANLVELNKDVNFLILADEVYCNSLRGVLGNRKNLDYQSLSRSIVKNKFLSGLNLVFNFFLVLKTKFNFKPDYTLFLTLEFTVFPIMLSIFKRIFKKTSYIIHQSKPLTDARKIKYYTLSVFLNVKNFNIIYLTNTVFKQLKERYSICSSSHLWQHPVLHEPLLKGIESVKRTDDVVKLLLFGKQYNSLEKQEIVQIIEMIEDYNSNSILSKTKKLRLTIPKTFDFQYNKYSFVDFIENNYLTRLEYLVLLQQSHFVFFLKDLEAEIRASGVAMDAIRANSIIVAPKYGFFEDLNNFTDNSFGYLFNPAEKFNEGFKNFLKSGINQYPEYYKESTLLNEKLNLNNINFLNVII